MPYVKSLNVAVEICVRMSPIVITVSSKVDYSSQKKNALSPTIFPKLTKSSE